MDGSQANDFDGHVDVIAVEGDDDMNETTGGIPDGSRSPNASVYNAINNQPILQWYQEIGQLPDESPFCPQRFLRLLLQQSISDDALVNRFDNNGRIPSR